MGYSFNKKSGKWEETQSPSLTAKERKDLANYRKQEIVNRRGNPNAGNNKPPKAIENIEKKIKENSRKEVELSLENELQEIFDAHNIEGLELISASISKSKKHGLINLRDGLEQKQIRW